LHIKDKHAWLSAHAREVNSVWNYSNELSARVVEHEHLFLGACELQKYTDGATKEGLGRAGSERTAALSTSGTSTPRATPSYAAKPGWKDSLALPHRAVRHSAGVNKVSSETAAGRGRLSGRIPFLTDAAGEGGGGVKAQRYSSTIDFNSSVVE
jgi:hypothetical protein